MEHTPFLIQNPDVTEVFKAYGKAAASLGYAGLPASATMLLKTFCNFVETLGHHSVSVRDSLMPALEAKHTCCWCSTP